MRENLNHAEQNLNKLITSESDAKENEHPWH